MLKLSGRYQTKGTSFLSGRTIARLSAFPVSPELRKGQGFLVRNGESIPDGYGFYMTLEGEFEQALPEGVHVVLSPEFKYLADGDVVRLEPIDNSFRVLFRMGSSHNSFLLTERCNNYCLMCSQPPRDVNDSWIVADVLRTIPLIDTQTREIGFTGGEPTLLGQDLFRILALCKSHLPNTAVHMLSNGRTFSDPDFSEEYASIDHPDLMVGIPLYSDDSAIHNYVVQADGAYDETIRGILNLKRAGQRVEIRVVLHQQTYFRLPQLAEFIVRNLVFVDHVALMGLENMGFARTNMRDLWIDPKEYQVQLREACLILDRFRIRTSIYNHQLCVLDPTLWRYARKSISDWKNDYLPVCDGCSQRENCGGFFSSTLSKHSAYIQSI